MNYLGHRSPTRVAVRFTLIGTLLALVLMDVAYTPTLHAWCAHMALRVMWPL